MLTLLRRTVTLLTLLLGVLTIMAPGRVQAQSLSQAQGSEALQEVVVTARKREEALLDAPVTVDAFTQQTIQAAGIESPRDFVALVPNMTMVEVQNVGNSFITIRGISQARNSEPSVAVVTDGVIEPNPYEFSEELNDVTSIQVIKGPQGALYGRNAIGGAIIINTAEPSDHFEGAAKLGVGNGVSERAQLAIGGPIDSAGTLKYRASVSYVNTDGYLENTYLGQKADPYREYSGRLRLLWRPNDQLTADLRFFGDYVETTAYYYVIPRDDEANPFSSFTTPPNANNVTSPIQDNNLGTDNRGVSDIALKLDYAAGGAGTFTSITDWDHTKEIDTGDAYDFRPIVTSIAYNCPTCFGVPPGFPTAAQGGPFDLSQSQFIDVTTWSQELRFTSNKVGGLAWILGAYFLHTERFISTDNIFDRGLGVPRVYNAPIVDPTNPYATNTNETCLADSQNNKAWAVYGDATYDFSREFQLDVALRYDEAKVQNTTDTPNEFLPPSTKPAAFTGLVRKETFDAVQPKFTLRYKPDDNVTLYGGWGRGFRSGGFNQTGVGAVAAAAGQAGVHDVFQAEIADTWEVGFKGAFLDRRLGISAALFDTKSTNGYFFYFDATTSTQNLGNLDATYKGGELQVTFVTTSWLDLYAGYGYTDGKITGMEDPKVIGNRPPLLTLDTLNAGFQAHVPLGGLTGTLRLDYQLLGRTWWDPYDVTSRDPVSLVDLRAGLDGGNWSLTAWSKNLANKAYNEEFSTGGFLWRALPRRYGVDFTYKF
ncbi:MAG TPA: TonB-dependent receptor [Steroidobacteraceae bacterium]|nr:TonB-dependent receptor [Steroidobacteraceae bacterium]